MSVVAVAEFEGGNQETYEQVSAKVLPDGQLPDGQQVHIAGPVENGWRVISVWDSEEQLDRFREERLLPALRESGQGEPTVQRDSVHRILTA
jgi:hypothetical protein